MHMIRRSAVALALASVVLSLAGCGGKDTSPRAQHDVWSDTGSSGAEGETPADGAGDEAAPEDAPEDAPEEKGDEGKDDAPEQPIPTRTPPPVGKAKVVPGETAEQFITRWYKVYAQMQNTGDTREYLGMAKKCEPCQGTAATVQEFYNMGGYLKTEGDTVTSVKPAPDAGKNAYIVSLKGKKTEMKMAKEAPVDEMPAQDVTYLVVLEKDGQSWQVVNYDYPEEQ